MARKVIKTEAALIAKQIITNAGRINKWTLQCQTGAQLGREVSNVEFEAAIAQFSHRRQRGVGGGISL
jgi:hypothetical protein